MKSTSEIFPQKTSSNSRGSKFIPNLTQLNEATKELPNPELWPDETYTCSIVVNEKPKTLNFDRTRISKGSVRPYRWIYNGKILIRNRDI